MRPLLSLASGSCSVLAGGTQFTDQLSAAVIALVAQHHLELKLVRGMLCEAGIVMPLDQAGQFSFQVLAVPDLSALLM